MIIRVIIKRSKWVFNVMRKFHIFVNLSVGKTHSYHVPLLYLVSLFNFCNLVIINFRIPNKGKNSQLKIGRPEQTPPPPHKLDDELWNENKTIFITFYSFDDMKKCLSKYFTLNKKVQIFFHSRHNCSIFQSWLQNFFKNVWMSLGCFCGMHTHCIKGAWHSPKKKRRRNPNWNSIPELEFQIFSFRFFISFSRELSVGPKSN